eukprot:GHVQ01030517.1.p1 GENE.GHVQ01030517.1~~GHVQ01030517.1.p1  ORF type:complete len:250 (-),score=20.46 GHVQ01030517.1:204-899(-)
MATLESSQIPLNVLFASLAVELGSARGDETARAHAEDSYVEDGNGSSGRKNRIRRKNVIYPLPPRWHVWGLGAGGNKFERKRQEAEKGLILHWNGKLKPWGGIMEETWPEKPKSNDTVILETVDGLANGDEPNTERSTDVAGASNQTLVEENQETKNKAKENDSTINKQEDSHCRSSGSCETKTNGLALVSNRTAAVTAMETAIKSNYAQFWNPHHLAHCFVLLKPIYRSD